MAFIDYDVVEAFSLTAFRDQVPFPWWNFSNFLTDEGFEALSEDFPSLSLFERHQGAKRAHGQRPHDRYYLAYESSIYHREEASEGVVRRENLPAAWQSFMYELEEGKLYREFLRSALSVQHFDVRYAWHVGVTGSEVSPHVDAPEKVGTHIFYFNRPGEWDISWGGSTLVLGGKTTDALNPEFEDFTSVTAIDTLGNRSFFFKNAPGAWHGVRRLSCPQTAHRRLFNVIVEFAGSRSTQRAQPSVIARVGRRLKQLRRGASLDDAVKAR
jgi:hypothetical protein